MASLSFDAGRQAERTRIGNLLRERGLSAMRMAKRGLLVEAEAERLKRWLNAAAQDVEAGLD